MIHLNILLLLGLALFGGTVGGRIFQKLRIPQVVGYIVIGILIGESGLRAISEDTIKILQPFNYFALGLIGFMVGGELKKATFAKYGKRFIIILLWEGVVPFLLVAALIGTVGSLFLGWKLSWALGLLFGAIASATDPASTTEVFREYKTRGPLTTTAVNIVALDDGLAFMLFAIASSVAGILSGRMNGSFRELFIHPFYEIGGAIALGAIFGFALSYILRRYSENARLLAFSIGTVLLVSGLALAIKVEMLLAAMTVGIVVVNFTPRKSKEIFELVGGFTAPIYVLFFVLIGAKLNFIHLSRIVVVLVGVYIFGTMVGKTLGCWLGAYFSQAPRTVKKYLAMSLFSQAGVAIGLSLLATQYFPGEIGNILIIVITTTTFILQLIGPPFVKFAVTKAGEVGLNITEEDFVYTTKAEAIMDQRPPLIYKNMPLGKILEIFGDSTNLYYPVVDEDKKLLGIITVDNIKNTFLARDAGDLILAIDVMEPAVASAYPQSTIAEVKKLFARYNLEYLPVVTAENKVAGFIERRMLYKIITTKIMELQKRADSLEKT